MCNSSLNIFLFIFILRFLPPSYLITNSSFTLIFFCFLFFWKQDKSNSRGDSRNTNKSHDNRNGNNIQTFYQLRPLEQNNNNNNNNSNNNNDFSDSYKRSKQNVSSVISKPGNVFVDIIFHFYFHIDFHFHFYLFININLNLIIYNFSNLFSLILSFLILPYFTFSHLLFFHLVMSCLVFSCVTLIPFA